MADKRTFRTATLKPGIDKAIAKDGAHVVLWGDSEEAIVLRFSDAIWSITRHPAIGANADRNAAGVSWQGVTYAATGERVAQFNESASLADWHQFYDDFFHDQQDRVRHCLADNSHAA